MIPVILQPHSNTNPSDKFRVTNSLDWVRFVKGKNASYPFVSFDTYREAQEYCNKMMEVW